MNVHSVACFTFCTYWIKHMHNLVLFSPGYVISKTAISVIDLWHGFLISNGSPVLIHVYILLPVSNAPKNKCLDYFLVRLDISYLGLTPKLFCIKSVPSLRNLLWLLLYAEDTGLKEFLFLQIHLLLALFLSTIGYLIS